MSKLMRVLSQLLRMWYSSSKDSTSSLLYASISSQASRFPFIHSTHNVCPGNLLCLLFFVVVQRLSVRYSSLFDVNPNWRLAISKVSTCLKLEGFGKPLRMNLLLAFLVSKRFELCPTTTSASFKKCHNLSTSS